VSDLRIAGLDLSLTSTGVALIQPGGSVSVHRIQPPKVAGSEIRPHLDRMQRNFTQIRNLVYGATHITVEGPSFGSPQKQHEMGGMWWMVMYIVALDNPDAEITVVAPGTLKIYATGKGNTLEKDEVAIRVALRYRDVVEVTNNDTADALVLAAMTADQLGCPLVQVPQTHRRALKDWPYR
jgi:crossover junction endodeoxyribonuclease RuvC